MSQVNIVWPIIHSTLQRLHMSEGKAFAGRHYLAFTWRCNVLQSACTIPQPDQQSATSDSSSIAFLTQIKRKLMDKCFAQTCPSVPLSVRHSTPCRLVHLQEPVFKIWKGAQAKEITHCLLVLDSITIFSRSSNTIPVHKINSPEVGCGKS